ncbi:type II secretion system protein [uncultured Ilyobacter sp.]|uniref:type II secretion system protein n=1 Tax=uncultured Ilyobacter sp. TaxID=544433 RepID=UPI0029F57899|nr:type II secretion system protein [uncultured Ilyobacter sp.]
MKKGFTLIELVVVVAMIFILSTAIMNKVGSIIKNSRDAKAYFITGEYRTVYKIAAIESEDGGNEIYFNDLVERVDRHAASELYSSDDGAEFKGAYANGIVKDGGIGGFLEVGTNTGGITLEGSTTPLILLIIEKGVGVSIADNSKYVTPDGEFNGEDTRGEEWDGIE